MFKRFHPSMLFLLLSLAPGAAQSENSDPWLLVETKPHVLKVMQGDTPLEVFTKIAIGQHGAGVDKRRNDNKTPLGEYRIGWINENSKFHRFFGLTYPNPEIAKRGFIRGLIDEHLVRHILRAHLVDATPPQDTPLGGQIGIHGVGAGNRQVHEMFDWTHGCIALTNEQIDQLTPWVRKGTLVVIR
ncbi:L,D-transpeptidase family protein [Methylococcus capsulatus]|uniref:L,D-transpeptidase n=2 Tax=Methylococcus TaxID=413 RepID=A0ABZ2F795_METCP|nr:L,D-transpeptidase [Methylococcus capsulatus]